MNSTPEPSESLVEEMPPPEGERTDETETAGDATAVIADPALLDAHDLALAALREVTPAATVGDPAGYRVERDGVVSLRFENLLAGYPGWFWTVSLARLDDAEPTVLEVELLPGDGALLAPDWVPWAERLADYQAAQAALAELSQDDGEGDEDVDLDDVDDLDAADFDDDGSALLHAGDVDGVDIDELDADESDEFDAEEFDSDDASEDGDADSDEDDIEDDTEDEDAVDEDDLVDDADDEDAEEGAAVEEDTDEYDPSEGDDSD
ncbi:DUF3027 domain-containing protein [Microbacterium deminutum]|uniref:DUF3027 domain-containing protein n=1 Tax=Microbacterium deminutum TaxID=344164 RepID=A0ABP5CQH7_9MICO